MRGGDGSQGGVRMDEDNGVDHFGSQVSSQEKTKMLKPRKDGQPPVQNVTGCIITKQQQNYDIDESSCSLSVDGMLRSLARLYINYLI